MDIITNEYFALVLIPILIGVLEVIKQANLFDERFIPIASLVLGLLFGVLFSGNGVKDGVISGLFIGLSAVGLYSGVSNVKKGIEDKID